MSSLATFVRQRIEYVNLMAQCGSTGDKHDRLKVDATAGILQGIRTVKGIRPDDAIQIHSIISGVLPAASVENIMTSLNGKVHLSGSLTGVVTPEKQVNQYIDVYMTEEAWTKFLDASGDPQTKL
eukprot:4176735-Pyramimonas_sp.AAC.1